LARLLRQPACRVHVTDLAEHGTGAADHASIERARLAATKAIRIALARIDSAHPGLGRHLSATVRRGHSCVYLPDPRAPVAWREDCAVDLHTRGRLRVSHRLELARTGDSAVTT